MQRSIKGDSSLRYRSQNDIISLKCVSPVSNDELSFPVEAMLDTGFTEFVAINQQDIESLGWSFLNQDKLKTAQGETTFDIYLGKVVIDRQEFEIPVFAGEEIQEVLLGSQWLKLFILVANYQEGRVMLE